MNKFICQQEAHLSFVFFNILNNFSTNPCGSSIREMAGKFTLEFKFSLFKRFLQVFRACAWALLTLFGSTWQSIFPVSSLCSSTFSCSCCSGASAPFDAPPSIRGARSGRRRPARWSSRGRWTERSAALAPTLWSWPTDTRPPARWPSWSRSRFSNCTTQSQCWSNNSWTNDRCTQDEDRFKQEQSFSTTFTFLWAWKTWNFARSCWFFHFFWQNLNFLNRTKYVFSTKIWGAKVSIIYNLQTLFSFTLPQYFIGNGK